MMIYGYCKEGSSYRALRLVKEMIENGMVPNVASYNLTIEALCVEGKWKEAEILLNDMIKSGLKPSISILDMIYKENRVDT